MYRKKIPFSSKDSIAGSVRGMKGCRKGAGRAITFILAGILAAAPVMNALAVEESDENRKMAEESGTGRGTTGNVSDRNSGGDDETAGGKTASKRQRELLKRIQSNLKTARQRTRIS